MNRFYSTHIVENLSVNLKYYIIVRGGIYQFGFYLELYSEGIEYLRLPFLDYCDSFNVKNIKYMLDKVEWDYEKLKQFPLEFFQCDFELLGTMFQTYNENVSKSIFGTNNPKIIAAVVYAHNVMRFYQSENQDDKNINVDVISFVLDQYYNEGQTMGQTTYYNQIAVGNDDEIKRFILNKIRNSSVHFRFRKVKDSDGKELEDKICIYDHDDQYDANGNPTNINFSAVIDIKDFVEIIHEIECDLEIIHPSKKTK